MPNYDMRCKKPGCGYTGEYSFSMNTSKENFPHCPNCDSTLEKAVQAPGVFNKNNSPPQTPCNLKVIDFNDVSLINSQTGEIVKGKDFQLKGLGVCPHGFAFVGEKKADIQSRNARITSASEN